MIRQLHRISMRDLQCCQRLLDVTRQKTKKRKGRERERKDNRPKSLFLPYISQFDVTRRVREKSQRPTVYAQINA